MGAEDREGTRPAACCGGESNQGASPNCACDSQPTPRSWKRTLIFAIILLAAIGVGAYSLRARSTGVPAAEPTCASPCSTGASCCPR
jgi:hypothetical protein